MSQMYVEEVGGSERVKYRTVLKKFYDKSVTLLFSSCAYYYFTPVLRHTLIRQNIPLKFSNKSSSYCKQKQFFLFASEMFHIIAGLKLK
jgi:hypothetical protein